MHRSLATLALIAPIALSTMAVAESHNPADYPIRLHIYGRNQTTFYHNRNADESKGEGRANLYENGEPHGIDFQYECDQRLQTSSGYETFPAKWKKPNAELVVLLPEFGKPGQYNTCKFKVEMKDFAYIMRNGGLASEPPAAFKQWMEKHEYDPEHGKNLPSNTAPAAQSSTPQPAAAPPQ